VYTFKRSYAFMSAAVFLVGALALGSQMGCSGSSSDEPATLCTETGGTVETLECCQSTSDFPNLCVIGACGCGPGSTHAVQICTCPGDECFDPEDGCTSL
jgi:hypothetical protein